MLTLIRIIIADANDEKTAFKSAVQRPMKFTTDSFINTAEYKKCQKKLQKLKAEFLIRHTWLYLNKAKYDQ